MCQSETVPFSINDIDLSSSEPYKLIAALRSPFHAEKETVSLGSIILTLEWQLSNNFVASGVPRIVSYFFSAHSHLDWKYMEGSLQYEQLIWNVRKAVGEEFFDEVYDRLDGGNTGISTGLAPSACFMTKGCQKCGKVRYFHTFCHICGHLHIVDEELELEALIQELGDSSNRSSRKKRSPERRKYTLSRLDSSGSSSSSSSSSCSSSNMVTEIEIPQVDEKEDGSGDGDDTQSNEGSPFGASKIIGHCNGLGPVDKQMDVVVSSTTTSTTNSNAVNIDVVGSDNTDDINETTTSSESAVHDMVREVFSNEKCLSTAMSGIDYFYKCTQKITKSDYHEFCGDMLFLMRNLAASTVGDHKIVSTRYFKDLIERWTEYHTSVDLCEDPHIMLGMMEGLHTVTQVMRKGSLMAEMYNTSTDNATENESDGLRTNEIQVDVTSSSNSAKKRQLERLGSERISIKRSRTSQDDIEAEANSTYVVPAG